jgi:Flp pilus assembly protein TadD
MAVAGDYGEALELYLAAARANPEDHEALFNAGVMCEAQGNFADAEKYYDQAFKIKPQDQYVLARKRMRTEGAGAAGAPSAAGTPTTTQSSE